MKKNRFNLLNIWYFILNILNFFKNIWRFKNSLWNYMPNDSMYGLSFFREALEVTHKYIEKYGYEVDEKRLKKCSKMKRAIQIMKNIENDDYIEMAENHLGREISPLNFEFEKYGENSYKLINGETPEQKEMNSEIYMLAYKLESQEWKELWKIFEGQELTNNDDWVEHDGSGLKGWWD